MKISPWRIVDSVISLNFTGLWNNLIIKISPLQIVDSVIYLNFTGLWSND
mgnify:CR=1 FL=1